MADDILTVPVSTVASEAAFSAVGRVIFEKRGSLSPDTIEALICLKDWQLAERRLQQAKQERELADLIRDLKISRPSFIEESDTESLALDSGCKKVVVIDIDVHYGSVDELGDGDEFTYELLLLFS
ncbi:hypothetical protein RHSIM_Rhsim10G0107700 [Rhododendron simsii]|uniref:HAT C-terminal dimerisation domain-containing protein n=1 Tax=Rhododendron simsii TaxID=118357 RepID=A0A834LE03_RHOSS|nr:hypothetical protein RHSIM_Rhsim10G0107700 [Rhododendron simsii]